MCVCVCVCVYVCVCVCCFLTLLPDFLLLALSAVHDGSSSGHRPSYNGVYDAFRRILKQDGFTGLYRVMPDALHSVLHNMRSTVYVHYSLYLHNATCTVL